MDKQIINNITEDYCSFEVAKLLKEKGFDAPCRGKIHCSHYHFVKNNVIPSNVPTSINELFAPVRSWNNLKESDPNDRNGQLTGLNTSIPTHSLACKWLRENYSINIYTDCNKINWWYCISKCGNSEIEDASQFNTPYDAMEAALLYTLKNLING